MTSELAKDAGVSPGGAGHVPLTTELMPLEERIMFDAAAALDAAHALIDADIPDAPDAARDSPSETGLQAAAGLVPMAPRDEIYFVDAGISDPATLIAGIPSGAEVILLDGSRDGVAQIAQALDGRAGLEAVHILAHGEEGRLFLGDAILDAGSIAGHHQDSLARIGAALSEDGDILIYGCDFTAGETGFAVARVLAEVTGADIAASNDLTGHAARGGDWQLETAIGAIEAQELQAEAWAGVLAPPTLVLPALPLATLEDTPLAITGVLVADPSSGTLTVTLNVASGTITLAQTTGLTVSGNGTGALTLGGSIANLNAALTGMTFTPVANANGAVSLAVGVSDGGAPVTGSVGIAVASVNDAPTLAPSGAAADEGGSVVLTEANFGLSDPDLDPVLNTNPQLAKQLVFKLDGANLPTEGTLRLNGAPLLGGSSFSLQDVRDGRVSYVHGGADVAPGATDDVSVFVNDGGGSGDVGPSAIVIALNPVNQAPTITGAPSVFEGQGSETLFATPGTITPSADIGGSLAIADRDDAAAASQITITNIDNAGEGTLFWDADGDGRLDPGEALLGGETFSAPGLAAGLLRFAHDGSEPDGTAPRFDITVTDAGGGAGAANALTSGPQTITIDVMPNDDDPDLTTNTGATVVAGLSETVTIGPATLLASDPDTASANIVYVVTEIPTRGELRIGGEILGVGGRFTQADILAGRIDYTVTDAFADGETDFFRFELRDSGLRAFNLPGLPGADRDAGGAIVQHRFDIALTGTRVTGSAPGDAAPGRSGSVAVDSATVTGVTVTEGDGITGGADTATITAAQLSHVLETDDGQGGTITLPADEVTYRITAAPGNGTLLLSGVALNRFDSFTQDDIDNGRVTFVHDGSENHQDQVAFSISGGTLTSFNGTFFLNAIPTNDAPSLVTTDLPILPEGGTERVTAARIALGDVDANDEPGEGGGVSDPGGEAVADDLMFRITDLPDHGQLQRWTGAAWVAVTADDLMPRSLLTALADGQAGGLRYVHDGSENHVDSFRVEGRDDLTAPGPFGVLSQSTEGAAAPGNLTGASVINVTVAPQNDAPVAPIDAAAADQTVIDANGVPQTTANTPLFLPEGGTGVIGSALLRSVDPDNTDPETLQYRITAAPQFGVLFLNGNALGVGSTYTQADIDAGRLSYQHDGSENFADRFRFIVSDSVSDHVHAPGGAGGPSAFDIFVDAARNDVPELVNAGSATIDLFGTFSHDFGTDLRIRDGDIDDGNVATGQGETDFVQVTVTLRDSGGAPVDLSATGGITPGSLAGVTLVDGDDSDGQIVLQGGFAAVQAALTNLVVELPNVDHNDTFTLDVTVDDRLRDAAGTLTAGANGDATGTTNEDGTPINAANNRDTLSVTLRASDDNDDPFLIASPGDRTVNEDAVLSLAGYRIEDVDAFDSPITVTLSVSNGHLSVTGNATTGSPSSLVLTGTVAQVNAQLDALTYRGNANFHSPDGTTRIDDDVLVITVNDGGANGTGGGGTITLTPTNIAIRPVNDAPSVTVPGVQTLASGTSITLSGALAPVVADIRDAGNAPFNDFQRLQVGVPAGTGTLAGSGASGLADLNGLPHVLRFEGTLAQLNAELNGLTFTPTNPNADTTLPIAVQIIDLGNGGTALPEGVNGSLQATGVISVQISSINDGPSVNALTDQSVNEDASLTFSTANGNAFTVGDPDDFNRPMVATLSVNHGVLTAAAGSGAAIVGNGMGGLTITGTEVQINAALNGLVYTPDPDFHTSGVAGDTLTVTINDQGNTGTGGALVATQTATITVNPVNDRPVASGGPQSVPAVGEDRTGAGTTLSALLAGNFSDATDNRIAVSGGDSSTPLSFVAITGSTGYTAAQGLWQVSDGAGGWIDVPTSGLSDTSALIVEASREIRFTPAADFFGVPGTLSVRLADGDPIAPIAASTGAGDLKALATEGGTTQTGRWSAGSVTLQTAVTGENDPPTAADATLAAVAEDSAAPPGASVAALFAPVFGDAADNQTAIPGGGNASTALGGIAIIGNAADPLSEGAWQYSTDGGGSWTAIAQGADDDTTAILLPGSALLRFVPVADYNGTPGALSVRLADAPQSFLAASDISGVVGNDPARDTDIWSVPVRLGTSVTPVNDAPSASPSQDFTLGEDDGPQTVAGFMQSIDPGGGPDEAGQAVSFAVTGITDGSVYTAAQLFAAQPVFTVATGAGNTLSFTPGDVLAQGETQTVTVTVSVTDDGGTADGGVDTGTPQTFTITLTGVNDAPTTTGIADQTSTDGQTIALDVSGSFSDPDGSDVLRFTATGLPPGLSIDPDTGLITGRIDFDASTGGPYTVTVTARDFDAGGNPTGTSVEATFTWGVANPPPVAVNDTDATDEATPISRAAGLGVIDANDSDGAPDGDALVVDQVNGSAGNVGTPVAGSAGGLFTLNADGSYDFDPNGDFASLGVGDSRATQITYRITDGEGGVSTATLTVTVTGVNDAPVARPDSGTTPEGTPVSGNVLTNDSDPEGDPLSVSAAVVDIDGDGIADPLPLGVPTLLRDAAGDPIGTLTLGANGAFTFAPAPNYAGPMPQVTYDVSDGAGGTATSTLNITVTPAIPAFPPTHGATGGADPVELSDRSRPGLVVDHIIDETANSQTSLFGTPALLSGLNTALGVEHPILTALDALQSLEGTAELSTRGADVFAGLAADGPITEAVRSIGFDPLDETLRVFNRDFPDEVHLDRAAPSGDPFAGQIAAARLEVPTRLGLMAGLAVETRGEAADIRLHLSDAAGETAPIATAQVRAGADADTGIARDGEGLHLTGLAAGVPVTLDVELVAGGNLSFVLMLRAQGEGVTISEPASGTFSAATAQIAQADRTEAAQLMQAVKWGTR